MIPSNAFQPARYLTNAHVQTILASSRVRSLGRNPMVRAAREMILDAGEGVRLQGFHSPQERKPAKGLVILLHGWEGSVESTYMMRTGRHLYQHGYDVFRLNYRDHGESHHLNQGLFYAILLEEVFQSVKGVAQRVDGIPVFLAGFSLGGNFALRIARRCLQEPIDNLEHIVTVSPLLDPDKTTDCVDRIAFIRKYFVKKWQRSLARKQALFPSLYDFSDLESETTIRGMTEVLLDRYSQYGSAKEYFKGYTLSGSALKDIQIPTTMITSEDDPIIPIGDFRRLETNEHTNLAIQTHGGHNGFIESLFLRSWYEQKMVDLFDPIVTTRTEYGRAGGG
jgi:predicted alpha/beta-fold hydrolase